MAKNLSAGRSGYEDGYYGVYSALNSYNFRETAVPIVVLITDEGRTNVNTQLNYSKLVNEVVEKNALLHGVFEANFYDKNGKRALGASYFGDAYLAGASATEYTVSTGGYCARGDWNTKETYVELLWDENVKGTAWDLNILRDGGAAAEQFSNAFVDYLTRDVLTRIPISISVDPGVEGVSNLSGIQTGTPGDKVASFDVQIDATVAPDYFYIYFKNAETGEQLGAIPVFFKGDGLYVYDVEAYDPDFDELSYSLTTAPNGMWLEPTTGLILWSPNYGDQGEHNVTVEVADGRGGVASQAFVVSVVDDANVAPTIVSKPATEIYVETQNDGLTFEALYEYDCEALDQDGDGMLGWNESSALTDENGFYLFENLPAGEYRVRYQPAYGFAQTYPVDGEWSVEDNLIVNGDFENVIAFNGEYYECFVGGSEIAGWQVTSGSVSIHAPTHNAMYDGVYCVDLQGVARGSLAQTFATVPGVRYAAQYVVAGNPHVSPSVKRYTISSGAETFYGTFDVSDKSPSEMGWEVRTWSFVATADETTLVFAGLDNTSGGALIDDVYVAPTTATPGGG